MLPVLIVPPHILDGFIVFKLTGRLTTYNTIFNGMYIDIIHHDGNNTPSPVLLFNTDKIKIKFPGVFQCMEHMKNSEWKEPPVCFP